MTTTGQMRFRYQLMDAHKKIAVAASPSPVRTACNPLHFSISARLSGPSAVRIENALPRLRSSDFQTFVHPVNVMEEAVSDAGFERVVRSQTAAWTADVYVRRSDGSTPAPS